MWITFLNRSTRQDALLVCPSSLSTGEVVSRHLRAVLNWISAKINTTVFWFHLARFSATACRARRKRAVHSVIHAAIELASSISTPVEIYLWFLTAVGGTTDLQSSRKTLAIHSEWGHGRFLTHTHTHRGTVLAGSYCRIRVCSEMLKLTNCQLLFVVWHLNYPCEKSVIFEK